MLAFCIDGYVGRGFGKKEKGNWGFMDKAVTKEEQKMNYEHESIPVSTLTDDVPRLTAVQAKALMSFLKRMFTVVHLVNPHRCEQYTIDSKGKVCTIAHSCFDEWGKGHCCENCVAATVLRTHRAMTKVEFVNNRLYGITASKILVDNKEYVLELASYAECETDSTGDDGGILGAITEHNKRL